MLEEVEVAATLQAEVVVLAAAEVVGLQQEVPQELLILAEAVEE